MINMQFVRGMSFEKMEFNQLLNDLFNISEYTHHELENSFDGHPIYGYSLGDLSKPTIYIQGQIHGAHEWRTVYWVKQFMEYLVKTEYHPHKRSIDYLREKYSFYFIPCASPDSYVNNNTLNGHGVDIPRNFDFLWEETEEYGGPSQNRWKGPYVWSESEARNVRDVVLQYKPVSFVCTHTWGDHSGFMVRRPQNSALRVLFEDIFNSIFISSKLRSGTDANFDPPLHAPSAYNWAGEQMSHNGKKTIAHVFEAGSDETTFWQSQIGVTGLLLHCLHIDYYLTHNYLTMY